MGVRPGGRSRRGAPGSHGLSADSNCPTAGLGLRPVGHTVVVIHRVYFDGFRPPVDPSVQVDATEWLDHPAGWPALLYLLGSPTAAKAFDIDPADVDVMLQQMERPDLWPVFSAQLSSGYQMNLLLRNFPDDSGLDYLLTHPDSDHVVVAASLEGCFQGPALSWQELVGVAQLPDPHLDPAERFLMLLSAMTDTSMPADAAAIVAEAVTEVGGHRHPEDAANELLSINSHFWGPAGWADSNGILVCLGNYSVRRIDGPWPDRQLISAALAAG